MFLAFRRGLFDPWERVYGAVALKEGKNRFGIFTVSDVFLSPILLPLAPVDCRVVVGRFLDFGCLGPAVSCMWNIFCVWMVEFGGLLILPSFPSSLGSLPSGGRGADCVQCCVLFANFLQ